MREYTIYWIRKEFCNRYFFRSEILFRFIASYHKETHNPILSSQFQFVAQDIPYIQLVNHIKSYYTPFLDIQVEGNQIILNGNDQLMVTMDIHRKQVQIRCQHIQDAESVVFQPLRTFDSCFFVIEQGVHNYGWISPLKKRKDILDKELLYSTR
ncbi:sporulation inhibitor of replication protein SirA [Aquibacillus sp. 3ASR75-11]|uniref:Sporulation inhibitor of replication protein SirA n=1 Tax=Terrihalobacillus insolitus TaxID=2950438 RepID=A0A9X3WU74_9BACI|nr:sporulation inhibitor of replication protein SirA [Terrihalobacillus insolitus]MDC3414238.1 sporulation inhibitor of replication protein SirA [Terrihalobacillus insolitus]MDC3425780.1 sporulation inhibitor of replication protein SirA [Terrihalobacillus insolitus]